MENKSEVIFDEINQIKSQYRVEVGAHRRAWPKSIRNRVIELQRLEFSNRQISEKTGISPKTIYSWSCSWAEKLKEKPKKLLMAPVSTPKLPKFIPLQIAETTQTLPKKVVTACDQKTVANIDLGNGIRIESVSVEFAVELIYRLKVKL